MPEDAADEKKALTLKEIRRMVEDILEELGEKGDSSLISRLVDYELKIKNLMDENKKLKELGSANPAEVEKTKQELFQLQEHYRTLYDYYQQVLKENEELKAKKGGATAVADDKRISELEAALKKSEEEKQKLKEELEKSKTTSTAGEDLNKKISELQKAFDQARQEAEAYRMRTEQARKELLQLKEINKKLLKYKEIVEKAMKMKKESEHPSETEEEAAKAEDAGKDTEKDEKREEEENDEGGAEKDVEKEETGEN